MQYHALFIHAAYFEKIQGLTKLRFKKKFIEHARSDQMAQQTKNSFAKHNQHCDATKENRKSQNNSILVWLLLNNAISLHTLLVKNNIAIKYYEEK